MFHWFGKVSFVPFSKVQDFAVHLKDGRLMGSKCTECGYQTFPPRADCPECMSGQFEFIEYSGKGTLYTYTLISAAPTGFDDMAPYTIMVVDLQEGGRLLGWQGVRAAHRPQLVPPLGLLPGGVLLLKAEQVAQSGLVQVAQADQDLAQPPDPALPGLDPRGVGELIHRDQPMVDR